MNPKIKAAVDFGPLLVFFIIYFNFGILPATGAIMAATLVALAISYALERKLAVMPLVSGILIAVFGSVTLILKDPIYLILKTTIFYGLASSVLAAGLILDRPFLKFVFGTAFRLRHEAWRNLTYRWIGFFVFLGALNVTVWGVWGLDVWVVFKVWAILPLFFLFTMAQMPFIMKNQIEAETTD